MQVETGYSNEMEMDQKQSPSIMMRLDSIDKLMETLHNEIVEFESRVSPVLHQEAPHVLSDPVAVPATDDSAVISQRLTTIQRRIGDEIEHVRDLSTRVEI